MAELMTQSLSYQVEKENAICVKSACGWLSETALWTDIQCQVLKTFLSCVCHWML